MSLFYRSGLSVRIRRRLNIIAHSCYVDVAPDYSRSVFICGSARSGTTWLAELLNFRGGYRLVYEPFNREQVRECRHFLARQYLRPNDDRAEYLEAAKRIFSGRIREGWIDQYNRCLIAHRRLVKDVRSTLMLKWIRDHFPDMPIIFIVRHPCAVTVSRLRLGYRPINREMLWRQEALMADHLAPFADTIAHADTPFERHLVDWCVENYVPFNQLVVGEVYLAFYESLYTDLRTELQKLYAYLGQSPDNALLRRLNRPSATHPKPMMRRYKSDRSDAVDGWRNSVSARDLAFAQEATSAFGLDRIYGNRSIADTESAAALLGSGRAGIPA